MFSIDGKAHDDECAHHQGSLQTGETHAVGSGEQGWLGDVSLEVLGLHLWIPGLEVLASVGQRIWLLSTYLLPPSPADEEHRCDPCQ